MCCIAAFCFAIIAFGWAVGRVHSLNQHEHHHEFISNHGSAVAMRAYTMALVVSAVSLIILGSGMWTVGEGELANLREGRISANVQWNSLLRRNANEVYCKVVQPESRVYLFPLDSAHSREGASFLAWTQQNCDTAVSDSGAFAAAQCFEGLPVEGQPGLWGHCKQQMAVKATEVLQETCGSIWGFAAVLLAVLHVNYRRWAEAERVANAEDDGLSKAGKGKDVAAVLTTVGRKLSVYVQDGWNGLDLLTHILVIACITMKFLGSRWCNVVSAITVVLGWMNSLSVRSSRVPHLQPFPMCICRVLQPFT